MEQLCEARGIDAENLIQDNSLLNKIPARAEIQDELLDAFYKIYSNAPKSKDFMERIVRRLAPEYKDDTVRTAILKKFLAGAGKDFKRFKVKNIMEWGKQRLSKAEQEIFSSLSEPEQRDCMISKIDDSIFTYEVVELSDADTFLLIANRMVKYKEDKLLAFEDLALSEETLGLMDEILEQHGGNVKGVTVFDKVLQLSEFFKQGMLLKDNQQGKISELVIKIETDFKNQLKNIPRISKTGKETNAAELYKQAKKDAIKSAKAALKKNGLDYELIDLCNDFAKGNFRVNGKTKEYLYYFAFMFEMTVPFNVLLNKKKEELAEYVAANYVVIPSEGKSIARIMVASEENTVSDLIDEIIEDIDAVYPDMIDNQLFALWQNQDNRKTVKNDILFHTDMVFEWEAKKLLKEKFGKDENFNILLSKLEDRVDVNKGRYNRAEKKRMI